MKKKMLTAAEMGRKGGAARAANMTKKQRSEGARLAAKARWDAVAAKAKKKR